MSEVTIRQAVQTDLPVLVKLFGQLTVDGSEGIPLPLAEQVWRRIAQYPDYRVYVAESEGTIIGSFSLLILDQLGHKGQASGIVESVVVERACRGQGVGKRMMHLAMDRCREAGCYKLALSSNVQRPSAHAFYESLGFTRQGYSFEIEMKPAP